MGKAKKETKSENKAKVGKIVAENAASGVADSLTEQAKHAVMPTRASVNQKFSDMVRGVPILGDIVDANQKAGYIAHLGKLFGTKKKKKDDK